MCSADCKLRPSTAVFLTDVAGVYSSPPSDPCAVLLSLITVKSDGSFIVPEFEDALHPDVTGGMRGKLEVPFSLSLGICM